MRAELLLKVAADPDAVKTLTSEDICELLTEDRPPTWILEEAARRTNDERVMAHLFSHPTAKSELLQQAIRYDRNRLERFKHHVNVYKGPPLTLEAIFSRIVPEVADTKLRNARLEQVLVTHLSPLCLMFLRPAVTNPKAFTTLKQRLENEADDDVAVVKPDSTGLHLPRDYAPSVRFLLLGDFLYDLTRERVETPRDFPVIAKVALALNSNQPLAFYLKDADIRVQRAAKERERWNEN